MDHLKNAVSIFYDGIAAVKPSLLLDRYIKWKEGVLYIMGTPLPLEPASRIYVLGAGKASAAMAAKVEEILNDKISGGIVVTKYGYGDTLKKIKLIEAGHPIPDHNSVLATAEFLRLTDTFKKEDVVLFLLSGGASSLLADYPSTSNLEEVQLVFDLLLKSGATIHEMNTVRKHLSAIKGGGLARHIYPAKAFTLILSDVIGDQPDVIGSGPTVPDPSTFCDARAILEKYGLFQQVPSNIIRHIEKGCAGEIADTAKKDETCFQFMKYSIIGNNRIALEAAAASAEHAGYHTTIITDSLSGEAKIIGASIVQEAIGYQGPRPACFLYGGESTVTIKGKGTGGRNQELALAAGIALPVDGNILLLSGGTDGSDGPTDAAGALADAKMMQMAKEKGLDAREFLRENDSYHFFSALHGLIKTGPTQTNVMDIIVVLVT